MSLSSDGFFSDGRTIACLSVLGWVIQRGICNQCDDGHNTGDIVPKLINRQRIQVFTGPVIQYLSSFWISLWCGTLSKALAKSIRIKSVCLLPLRLARISCMKAGNCVSVDCWLRGGLVGVLRLCVPLVCCTHT